MSAQNGRSSSMIRTREAPAGGSLVGDGFTAVDGNKLPRQDNRGRQNYQSITNLQRQPVIRRRLTNAPEAHTCGKFSRSIFLFRCRIALSTLDPPGINNVSRRL